MIQYEYMDMNDDTIRYDVMCDTTEADFIVNYFSDPVHNNYYGWLAGWGRSRRMTEAEKCPDLLTFCGMIS